MPTLRDVLTLYKHCYTGNLILTGAERAEQERQRAEQEQEKAQKLAAKLRELGIDPDTI